MNLKEFTVGLLGSRPVSWAVRMASPPQLRVLAYHGVNDPRSFRRHLDEVLLRYPVVSGTEVVAAARGEAHLHPDAVWITFDDGLRTVVEHALPLLVERSLPATMFVSPGFVDGHQLPWWVVVEAALTQGWRFGAEPEETTLRCLKLVPDAARRSAVESALAHCTAIDRAFLSTVAADRAAVGEWLAAGLQVGNHTWDHPCLDRCDADEQAHQIARADSWLADFGAFAGGKVFAYPNGDWTESAERTLIDLAYDVALLFDHRSSKANTWNPLRTSRFRVDAFASTGRVRAVTSGAHSLVFGAISPLLSTDGSGA